MPRSSNAQLAVEMYRKLNGQYCWDKSSAWQGIARLLLSCKIYEGKRWKPFHDVVVYRERNDFKKTKLGPNAHLRRGEDLSTYLAKELGISRESLCDEIGHYWKVRKISKMQPHNLVGNAFRSLIVEILEKFGDGGLSYEEEVDPRDEFPGSPFITRSKKPSFDIVSRRGNTTVALISARWRVRHDRMDVIEEAIAYASAARRHNPKCQLLAMVGEFDASRLDKILSNCPPANANPALSAAVHFEPKLLSEGLGENGRLAHLKSLEWLIDQTFMWA